MKIPRLVASFILAPCFLTIVPVSNAQGPPPPPRGGELQPLNPPPAPAANPVTAAKANLGKALFWDEQLSSTRTISCGTCHQPSAGGSDPRSQLGNAGSTNPGPDGVAGTADDVTGSPGVPVNNADGRYVLDDFFRMTRQVTGRYAPSAINAGYSPSLFWDGRAPGQFVDPETGQTLIANGAALESQAAGPPLSAVEMAHGTQDWTAIASRVEGSRPLALAESVPGDLETWIDGRNYPGLFEEAFGDDAVTAARIIMAIATYERTLVSNQAPIDDFIAGTNGALTAAQQRGLAIFNGQGRCVTCHQGNRFTDDNFHYIGVRPQNEDVGREAVTGNANDRGRMKTPGLRNVALKNDFMRNGRLGSLAEVIAFYNRGGDFNAPNKNNNVRPLGLNAGQQADLVAFLQSLTDDRVATETDIFSRPVLFAGGVNQAVLSGTGVAGTNGEVPHIVAIEPPLKGNPNFTVAIHNALAGARATLIVNDSAIGSGSIPSRDEVLFRFDAVLDVADGFGSVPFAIPGDLDFDNLTLHAKWFVEDPAASSSGLAETASATFSVFGDSAGNVGAPVNVSASDEAATSQINITWNAVSGAESYQVYRDGSFLAAPGTNSLIDLDVSPGESFSYEIVAVTATEAGPKSVADTGSAAVDTPVTPVPENLTATDGAHTDRVALTWDAVEGASSYTVYRGTDTDFVNATEQATVQVNGYDDLSAAPGTIFHYWVTAAGGAGESAESNPETGFVALGAVSNVEASSDLTDQVRLTWSTVNGAVSYEIVRSTGTFPDEGDATSLGIVAGTTFSDTAAVAGTTYHYWIQAQGNDGIVGARVGPVAGLRQEVVVPPPVDPEQDRVQTPGETAESPTETHAGYDETDAGRYWGLLHDSTAQEGEVDLLGYASVRLVHSSRTGTGGASLSILYEGNRYRFRTGVNADGSLVMTFVKKDGDRTEMTFSGQLVDTENGGKLTGTLTGDGIVTEIELCHREYHQRNNPADDIAGRYTLILPSDPDADHSVIPGGDGAAAGKIQTNGRARFGMRLGDGSRTTVSMVVGPDRELMFYRRLYRGNSRGYIGGKLTIRDVAGISDADGTLQWTRGENDSARRYAAGFDLQQPAVASRYAVPNAEERERVLAEFSNENPNAIFTMEGGNLAEGEISGLEVAFSDRNRISHSDETIRLNALAKAKNGRVSGRYRDSETGSDVRFYGVAFQKQGIIAGHFAGEGETGYLQVLPIDPQ